MEKIIFTNSIGESIEISNSAPFVLIKIEGTGGSTASIQMEKSPFQQGKTYVDTLMEERNINLHVMILAEDEEEIFQNRRLISRIFNPLFKQGQLKYAYDGGEKEINVVVERAPVFNDSARNPIEQLECLISIIAPLPFWLDIHKTIEELITFEGGFSFTASFPTRFAIQSLQQSKIVLNAGDVETPVLIALAGPATEPIRITNETTGKFIEIKRSLQEGEVLEINTEFGKKRVQKFLREGTRQNVFNYININSTFWNLIVGNNKISYSTGMSGETASMTLVYKNRYVGV